MQILQYVFPPLVGALIGYCTNYIAVRMMFRPLRPVKIGKVTLPFTPGIIPKRKKDIARVIGRTIDDELFGKNEIEEILKSDNMKNMIISATRQALQSETEGKNVRQTVQDIVGEEKYENKKNDVCEYITDRVISGISKMDIEQIMIEKGKEIVSQMGGLFSLFAGPDKINGIASMISSKLLEYINSEEGRQKIYESVSEEAKDIEVKQADTVITPERIIMISYAAGNMYEKMVDKNLVNIIKTFNVSGIVEQKINDMDMEELEKMILSVMKHELGMVVNLGALIGFVLGLINLII